jgi:hypothetical protein
MIGLLCIALAVLASPFKSKLRLEADNAVLRHQLIVLNRRLQEHTCLRRFALRLRAARGPHATVDPGDHAAIPQSGLSKEGCQTSSSHWLNASNRFFAS